LALLGLLGGCIDLEGAYRGCVADGRCDGGVAAGGGAQGAGGSGGGAQAGGGAGGGVQAGGGAGGGTAGPRDAGTPCSGSLNPRLLCAPPVDLVIGATGIRYGALAGDDAAFYAAWVTDTDLALRRVVGLTSTSLHDAGGLTSPEVAVDVRNGTWALVWTDGAQTHCRTTGSSLTGVTYATSATALYSPTVAVNLDGGVAVAAIADRRSALGGQAVAGCPSALGALPLDTGISVAGLAVVATTAAGSDGFRYLRSGTFNLYNGGVDVTAVKPDGGSTQAYYPVDLNGPDVLAGAAGSDGVSVVAAFAQLDAVTDAYTLGFVRSAATPTVDSAAVTLTSRSPGTFSAAHCGPGCLAAAMVDSAGFGPATVFLRKDVPGVDDLGAWDVACRIPGGIPGTNISVAWGQGRLGVLLTSNITAQLYVCELPPY
jgi:hypothetical protein